MSLKAIHIVFILAATLLAFGFGAWALRGYFSYEAGQSYLVMGVTSVCSGFVLLVYGRYFLRKLRNIGYL